MKRGGSHLRIGDLRVTWLIVGGTGQLGSELSRELSVRGFLFYSWGSEDLDITQGPMVRGIVSKLSPKVIINCAAWTDVDGAERNEIQASRVNRGGAENIALAAKSCNAKLVHISTDYVFSGESNTPWQVDGEMNPQSAYGRTKADGENRALDIYPENTLIVRTAWLYSPWGKNFAKSMVKLALSGKGEVRVVSDQIGQPTLAQDLAKQIVDLVISGAPSGIYHGTNGGHATWFEFAQEIFKLAGADVGRVVPISSSDYPHVAKRPTYSVLSHDAWDETTIEPMRDWRIALAESLPAIISAQKAKE
jgi:dTDP-4-dehydrorhamnose reductase